MPAGALQHALAATLALALAVAAHAGPTLQRIRERGAVVIGHRESSVPLSYLADGAPTGYSVEVCLHIAAAIARELGLAHWRVLYRAVTSASRFRAVERGDIDLECGSTTNTAERRRHVAFTIAHFIAASRLLVLSRRPWQRIEDLDGRNVASTSGTTNIQTLARQARLKGLTLHIVPVRDHAEGVTAVLAGWIDAFAMDDVLLYGLRAATRRPEALKVVGKPMTVEPYAIAFSRDDPELKRIADTELRRLIASGELKRLYARWFEQPIPPRGVNLHMPMSYLLADSLKFPDDYVP